MDLYPKFNVLDEYYEKIRRDLDDGIQNHYKTLLDANKPYQIQDEILDILEKNNIQQDIIKIIKEKQIEYMYAVEDEIDFYKKYYFKTGILTCAELNEEIKEEIKKQRDLQNYI